MIEVYIDGTSRPNPGKMGIGVVVVRDNKVLKKVSESPGRGTNNRAEYLASIKALKEVRGDLVLLSDSQLLVKQLNGDYRVKDKELRVLKEEFDKLRKGRSVHVRWIPREKNKVADALAKAAV